MDVERWDAWLERVIVFLVGGAIAFGVLAFGGVRVRDFLVIEVLAAAALGVWFLRLWTVREHRLLWPPICWGVLAFALWAIARTLVADLPYVAWGELMRILTYTGLFFVAVNNLHRQDTAQGLAWFLAGLATLLCFYGAWQFASASNTVWGFGRGEDYIHRASGSYANPNHFAGLLELLLPLALATLIAGRVGALGRVLLGYAIIAMLAGLTLTFSRGGWLAAGVGLCFVFGVLTRHRDYRWAAIACLVLLIGAGIMVASRTRLMRHRLSTSHDLDPQARNSRPQIWRAAIAMWRDHPWFGVGPAHFNERFKQYRNMWAHGEPERAHNDYLDALADWGIVGTALAVVPWCLLAYGVARTLKQVRRDPGDLEVKRSSRFAFVLGAMGGLVALLAHSLIDFNFHIPANALIAVTWMALLTGYSRFATDDWWVSSKKPWRLALSVLVILPLVGVLGWDSAHRGREALHLERATRADRAAPASATQLAELQAAWAIEPRNAWTAYHIGSVFLRRSKAGMKGYEDLARQAFEWFNIAARVNPFHPAFRFSAGICLDWIGDHAKAEEYFRQALQLDPEGRITSFHMGYHELQVGNIGAAREWFTKSTTQGWPPYQQAVDYLRLLNERTSSPIPIGPVIEPAKPTP